MLLMTSNPEKFLPIRDILINMGILPVRFPAFKELQTDNAEEAIRFKAEQVKAVYPGNFLVDDTMLVLAEYPDFPGPYTKFAIRTLGRKGMASLTTNNNSAKMLCRMGGYIDGNFIHTESSIDGKLDCSISPSNEKMKLSSWFMPNRKYDYPFPHRVEAATKFVNYFNDKDKKCEFGASCIFCDEFKDPESSVYKEIAGESFPSNRIVKETDSFILMPPLGEFVEGGLLAVTKNHIISMAWLEDPQFDELSYLLSQVKKLARQVWNKPLLIFEHGPYNSSSKNCSCVSHAHLNIFPVSMDISSDLDGMFSIKLDSLSDLKCLRDAADYILLIDNDDNILCFFPKEHISQLVRKIITRKLGFPERGHWMDYLGLAEFGSTLKKCDEYFTNERVSSSKNYEERNTQALAEHWDEVAGYWENLSKSSQHHYNRDGSYDVFSQIARAYTDKMKPDSVLEIGCGTGSLLQSLPAEIKKYGIDISSAMIRIARNKKIENAEFFIHDIFTMPYPVNGTPIIFSRGILISHYGKKNAKILINILYDIMPRGGIFIFDVLLESRDVFAGNKHTYVFDEIQKLFKLSGFSSVSLFQGSARLRTQIFVAIK